MEYKKFVIPYITKAINSIKQNEVDTYQIIRVFMDDLVSEVEKNNRLY